MDLPLDQAARDQLTALVQRVCVAAGLTGEKKPARPPRGERVSRAGVVTAERSRAGRTIPRPGGRRRCPATRPERDDRT